MAPTSDFQSPDVPLNLPPRQDVLAGRGENRDPTSTNRDIDSYTPDIQTVTRTCNCGSPTDVSAERHCDDVIVKDGGLAVACKTGTGCFLTDDEDGASWDGDDWCEDDNLHLVISRTALPKGSPVFEKVIEEVAPDVRALDEETRTFTYLAAADVHLKGLEDIKDRIQGDTHVPHGYDEVSGGNVTMLILIYSTFIVIFVMWATICCLVIRRRHIVADDGIGTGGWF
ncbi:hypothetical protein BaRGS_00007694 [Batillaria attramentaria]|uniref:Uncharacterized protein n=1 Tax=Batillaria attramentaria TaxID=370345 RepID=A0ABD0LP13_9CAEN